MIVELVFLLQTDLDIQTAYEHYEDIQEGRGDLFLRHLDAAFSLLRSHPSIGSKIRDPYRRLLVSNFPYGIFYTVSGSRVMIAAIQNLHQDPDSIYRILI